MNPDIALTLETMGVSLGNVITTLDLESALNVLGVRLVVDDSFPRNPLSLDGDDEGDAFGPDAQAPLGASAVEMRNRGAA